MPVTMLKDALRGDYAGSTRGRGRLRLALPPFKFVPFSMPGTHYYAPSTYKGASRTNNGIILVMRPLPASMTHGHTHPTAQPGCATAGQENAA